MCGLWGVVGSNIIRHEYRIIEMMSYLTSMRGTDSTGAALIVKAKKKHYVVHNYRSVLIPPSFVKSEFMQKKLQDEYAGSIVGFLGHNRAATIGSIKPENAHPFRCGKIIGMHNGTIPDLQVKGEDKTDSEKVFESINEVGLERTLEKISKGAFALVWVNTETNTVHFYRNEKRPLYYKQAPGGLLVWMSEKWMLDILGQYLNWPSSNIIQVETDTLYSIPFGTNRISSKEEEEKDTSSPFIEPIPFQKPSENYGVVLPTCYPYHSSFTSTPSVPRQSVQQYKGPEGTSISTEEATELLKHGCLSCMKEIPLTKNVHWISSKLMDHPYYFCNSCHTNRTFLDFGITPSSLVKGEPIYGNVN